MRTLCLAVILMAMGASNGLLQAQPATSGPKDVAKAPSADVVAGVRDATTNFLQQLKDGREDVQKQAFRTGLAYASLRILLIVLATTVAFGKNFAGTPLKVLLKCLAPLSLVVAIGTGVDTFLKLGERSRGHYNYVSNVEDLEIRAKILLAGGGVTSLQLQDLNERYSAIKAQHHRETAY